MLFRGVRSQLQRCLIDGGEFVLRGCVQRCPGSGFCRGGEYTATWPIGAFDADSKVMLRELADVVPWLGWMGCTL